MSLHFELHMICSLISSRSRKFLCLWSCAQWLKRLCMSTRGFTKSQVNWVMMLIRVYWLTDWHTYHLKCIRSSLLCPLQTPLSPPPPCPPHTQHCPPPAPPRPPLPQPPSPLVWDLEGLSLGTWTVTSWVCFFDVPVAVLGPARRHCTADPRPQRPESVSRRVAGEAEASRELCERCGGPWCRQYPE